VFFNAFQPILLLICPTMLCGRCQLGLEGLVLMFELAASGIGELGKGGCPIPS